MTATRKERKLILDSSQKTAFDTLIRKIRNTHSRLQAAEDLRALSIDRGMEFANVFGIVGPRGAGKSTLLARLYLERKDPRFEELEIIRPLDCSTLLHGVEPGMAILIHLWSELKEHLEKGDQGACSRLGESREEKLKKKQDDLLSTYMWSVDAYRDLELDLASSPQNFALALVKDTRRRMHLKRELAAWLDDLLEFLKRKALIILLDDFDLVHARQVRGWFHSLLDDFHQARLLFVLTGDFHRLEHLIFDHEAEIDDKTARAQLEKLLPLHHRVPLDSWAGASRKDWPPDDTEGPKLSDLVREVVDLRIDQALLCHLLPSRPRGLGNFYRSLAPSQEDPGTDGTSRHSARVVLETLATCRGEPLLARHLRKNGIEDWTTLFLLGSSQLSLEDWRESVRAARQRAQATQGKEVSFRPIRGLDLVPLEPPEKQKGQSRRTVRFQRPEMLHVETSGAAESQDPLRHEDLWHAPLRDAEEAAQPFWAELLLDLGFSDQGGEEVVRGWPVRNRVRFIEAWQPAVKRLGQSRIDLDLSQSEVRESFSRFLEDYDHLDMYSLLSWVLLKKDVAVGPEQQHDGRRRLVMGWSILFEGLRHGRPMIAVESAKELAELDLDLKKILQRDEGGRSALVEDWLQLEILPDRLWAMVLLIDAIDRCPWSIFSLRLGWHLPTYFALTGALMQGAYLHALKTSGLLEESKLKPPQQKLVVGLERRDASWILLGDKGRDRYEENVFERLREVLRCDLPDSKDDPLSRAARRFFELAPYRALRELAEEEPQF